MSGVVYLGTPATGAEAVLPVLGDELTAGPDPFDAAALEAFLAGRAGVRVLLPVRRQDRFMEHAHLDAVRRGGAVPFAQQFPAPRKPTLDWAAVAERCRALPGVAAVDVLPLDLGVDPLAQILDALGLPARPAPPAPPTYSARGIRVARALNAHLETEAERALVRDFVAATFPGPDGPDQFLSAGTRARIVAAYADANRRLFRDWLPGHPENAWTNP